MVILEKGFDIEEPSIELFNHQSTSSFEALYYLFQINSRKHKLACPRIGQRTEDAEETLTIYLVTRHFRILTVLLILLLHPEQWTKTTNLAHLPATLSD